jgi:chromosome segregation ATPase
MLTSNSEQQKLDYSTLEVRCSIAESEALALKNRLEMLDMEMVKMLAAAEETSTKYNNSLLMEKERLGIAKEECEQWHAEVTRLQCVLDDERDISHAYTMQIEVLENTIRKSEQTANMLADNIEKVTSELGSEIDELKAENDDLLSHKLSLEEDLCTLKDRFSEVSCEIESARAEGGDLEQRLREAVELCADLSLQLRTSESELQDFQARVNESEDRRIACEREIVAMEDTYTYTYTYTYSTTVVQLQSDK